MPNSRSQQIEDLHFRILKMLHNKPNTSQREIAAELNISIGKINYCLKAMIEKGFIKLQNFSNSQHRWHYAYVLTPTGLAQKASLTVRFLKRKIAEYEALKAEIVALKSEMPNENQNDISDTDHIVFNPPSQSL